MQIVINKCYGGFRLSARALQMYADRKGLKYKEVYDGVGVLTDESGTYRSGYDISRDDPDLISIVYELGSAANSDCADLKIIEIPDGVEWQIEDYDGMEWVAEKHNIWS